ncbi:hypothetical protein ACLMJK_007532 [Lecanora helva]
MYTCNPTLLLTLLLPLLPSALSSGIPLVVSPGLNYSTNPNVTAHAPSCTNLTSAPTIPCYTKLNVTGYLKNYNSIKAETCAPQQAWSTCLLTTIYQVPGTNCTRQGPGVQKCIPFDCYTLKSTTCVRPSTTNRTGIGEYDAAGWYAAWNVYSVHQHIASWAVALTNRTSEHAILAAINPRVPNTATSVLTTLLKKYSINHNADSALVALLKRTAAGSKEPAYGNARIRGERNTVSGAAWRGILYRRLEGALVGAAGRYGGFGEWVPMVEEGAFSTRGLAGVDALTRKLAKG